MNLSESIKKLFKLKTEDYSNNIQPYPSCAENRDYNVIQPIHENSKTTAEQPVCPISPICDFEALEKALATADAKLKQAIEVVVEAQMASTTLLQRKLSLGYTRAAMLIENLEEFKIVGSFQGSKPREVLVTKEQWDRRNDINKTVENIRFDTVQSSCETTIDYCAFYQNFYNFDVEDKSANTEPEIIPQNAQKDDFTTRKFEPFYRVVTTPYMVINNYIELTDAELSVFVNDLKRAFNGFKIQPIIKEFVKKDDGVYYDIVVPDGVRIQKVLSLQKDLNFRTQNADIDMYVDYDRSVIVVKALYKKVIHVEQPKKKNIYYCKDKTILSVGSHKQIMSHNEQKNNTPEINIDVSKLQKIRESALKTQSKLIMGEELSEEVTSSPHKTESVPPLSDTEHKFLMCMLFYKPYDEIIRESGIMLSVLVDAVNEKLFDKIGDTAVVYNNNIPELLKDYVEDLKRIFIV